MLAACKDVADHLKVRKKVESVDVFDHITDDAEAYVKDHGKLPVGESAALPAGATCCGMPDNTYPIPPTSAWKADPVWGALGFSFEGTDRKHLLYTYKYTGSPDGLSFRVTATGDTDCDGVFATFTLDGKIVDGKLQTTVTPPPNPD